MRPVNEQLDSLGIRPGSSGTYGATSRPTDKEPIDTKAAVAHIRADREREANKASAAKETVAMYTQAKAEYEKKNKGN